MKKGTLPRSARTLVPLIVLFGIMLVVMPRTGKFGFEYRKGSPWIYETLVAQFDFPILKTAEQLRQEKEAAGSSVLPYYRHLESVSRKSIRQAENIPLGAHADLKPRIVSLLSSIYDRGVMDEGEESPSVGDGSIFVQRDRRAVLKPVSEVFTLSGAKARLLNELAGDYPSALLDSIFTASGVYDLVQPNLRYDAETSQLVQARAADYISATQGYVKSGELIVSKGEIVTAEISQLLDSYKAEYENSLGYSGPRGFLWAGNGLIALALVIILYLSVWYTNPLVFESSRRYIYILFIMLLPMVGAVAVDRTRPDCLYLVPFTLTVLYMMAFFRKRVVLPVYIISLIPLLIYAHNGTELFVMNMVAGVVTMYFFQYFNKGWRQFVTAFIAFITLTLTYLGFHLIDDAHSLGDPGPIIYLFFASMLSVAGYPLIYLFEKMFSLVSGSRLQELCDTGNNKLLKDLAAKAPGTFQHSLQVMNMAGAAAESIDANVLLARAGALYHDIGKIENPQCFIENESLGKHYHEGLGAKESARDIIRHVTDGLALAAKYGLPDEVAEFIRTHHGTTCTGYFYNKYLNEGGDPADNSAFCYPGGVPRSKEQVIVMLCDTLEAASRTLKDNSPETFDAFVESIVDSKMKDGQFEEADISLRELGTLKSVLKAYLRQLYHERVEYPKNRKK